MSDRDYEPNSGIGHALLWTLIVVTMLIASGLWATAGEQHGIASTYGYNKGAGDSATQRVACGGRLNTGSLTAAHRVLPCGTRVTVRNKRNGRSVVVRVNDRGPFIRGRVIDLSPAAARAIGISYGIAPVELTW